MYQIPFYLPKTLSRKAIIVVLFSIAFISAGVIVRATNGSINERQETADPTKTSTSDYCVDPISKYNVEGCGLGSRWDETEASWTSVWTTRGESNIFDAVSNSGGQQITYILTINLQGNNVTAARRQSSDGNDCDYVGTVAVDGVSVQGTYQCTRFPPISGWQAIIRCPTTPTPTPTPNSTCAPIPSNLVSWWRAEGNANDSVGSNNGTLLNGANFASGMVGQGFNLDGSTQYVVVPHSDSINPTDALTVETWAKVNTLPTGNPWSIVTKDNPASGPYDITIFGDGRVVFGVYTNGWQQVYAPAGSIVPGNFVHLAGTYDSTTAQLCLYVNGVSTCSTAQAGTIPRVNLLKIGGSTFYNTTVNGIIDEVSIYNRALTASEVQAIYNAGSAGKCGGPTPTPAPISLMVSPASGMQSATTFVSNGSGLTFNGTVKLLLIDATNVQQEVASVGANGAGLATTYFTTSCAVLPGNYSLQMKDVATNSLSNSVPITITESPGCVLAQTINQITPDTVVLNTRTQLVVKGSNFGQPFTASVTVPGPGGGTFPIGAGDLSYISQSEVRVWVQMGGTSGYNAILNLGFIRGNATRSFTVVPATPAPTIINVNSPVIAC